MRLRNRLLLVLPVAAACSVLLGGSASARTGKLAFRICQYNVHFDYEDDGAERRWVKRRDLCSGLLLASKASVACIQEEKDDQVDDLKARMPGWTFVGRGRLADGKGEHTSVLFKSDVWSCVDHGDFWLSDTPDTPGSISWGCKYTHKATWALLKLAAEGKSGQVVVISTHFDENAGMDEARKKSSEVVRTYIGKHFKKANIVVCGDFNSAVTDASHEVMADTSIDPPLQDVWDVVRPPEPAPGTVHHWTGVAKTKRIDWIFMGGGVTANSIHIDRWNKDGKYGSYHFAVEADLELPAEGGAPKKKDYVEPQVK
jgi:endonuclease/exonuclease/phosphatase family metal-dependent hydrolase